MSLMLLSGFPGQPMKCTLGIASPVVEKTNEGTRCDLESHDSSIIFTSKFQKK